MKKKMISLVLVLALVVGICPAAFATGETVEEYKPSVALADQEIMDYLVEHNKLHELMQAQDEIRNVQYEQTANCISMSNQDISISIDDVANIVGRYDLQLPNETADGIIDNGAISVKRNSLGDIIDLWYLYYVPSDTAFSIKAALIDSDNPLDVVSGTLTCYYLNRTTWTKKNEISFEKKNVTNGNVYSWILMKWGVKEKFEYDITVDDNFLKSSFNNKGEDDQTRYNFEAKPYSSFTANGGDRHHFIPAAALQDNGWNSNQAYCIRMMVEDHKKTASYGNAPYVTTISSFLKRGLYTDAIQLEVNDLKSRTDSEGIYSNLQQKYYDAVIICIQQYQILFGVE